MQQAVLQCFHPTGTSSCGSSYASKSARMTALAALHCSLLDGRKCSRLQQHPAAERSFVRQAALRFCQAAHLRACCACSGAAAAAAGHLSLLGGPHHSLLHGCRCS